MLNTVPRVAVIAVVSLAAVAAGASTASADPIGGGGVDCEKHPQHPECTVTAEVLAPGITSGPDGEVVCTLDGEVVPCVTEDGWLGSDGCRYLLQPDAAPPPGAEGPGGSYLPTCPGDPPDSQQTLVWIPDSESPVAALADVAVSRLQLPPPSVELSPSPPGAQLVRLPTWLWITPSWWGDRTATASVPGVTVTAVGRPTQVRWEMGDGAVKTCDGPGTPYARAGDPTGPSPDCGHTYVRSSAGQPGGTFGLAATVRWEVTWSGAGLSGSEDPLFSTAEVAVPVSEVQTVIVP
jgi:hypothetical protein